MLSEQRGSHAANRARLAIVVAAALLLLSALLVLPRADPRCDTASSSAASGVTGRLFRGQPIRTYSGRRGVLAGPRPIGLSSDDSSGSSSSSGGGGGGNWAVVTTIHEPSEAILQMVARRGWSVVVVGDRGGAPFSLGNVTNAVFLGVEEQEQMAKQFPGFIKLLPWKHFGRKNVGFLYAILHGADAVWDFDDDNILKEGAEPIVPQSEMYLVRPGPTCRAFNPYPLMGAPSEGTPAWPRGFPLGLIRRPCNYSLKVGGKDLAGQVGVLQSLADNEPDVDGIFRLTRNIPFDWSKSSRRSLVLPRGVVTPYNAQATLVTRPALWSLLLPVSVHGRVSDIWRGYIAQRIMHDTGHLLAFSPPLVKQVRNPHNPLADMQAEEDLYYKSMALVERLHEWRGTQPTVEGRLEELLIDLHERGYLGAADVALGQQWLLALRAAGYRFPPLLPEVLAAGDEGTEAADAGAAAVAGARERTGSDSSSSSSGGGGAVGAAGQQQEEVAGRRRLRRRW